MQNFFHANTSKHREACKKASVVLGAIFAVPVLLSFMSLILQTRLWSQTGFVAIRLCIAGGCVALWMLISFAAYAITETAARRITRSTYFEIQGSSLILSRYSGKIHSDISKTQRRLWVIPLENMKAELKNGKITFHGDIRYYEGDSEWLGYHIKRGKPEFDNWWLNSNGYTAVSSVRLPSCFARQGFILKCCRIAQKKQLRLAEQKKLIAVKPSAPRIIKRPIKRRIYTELPTFDRKW